MLVVHCQWLCALHMVSWGLESPLFFFGLAFGPRFFQFIWIFRSNIVQHSFLFCFVSIQIIRTSAKSLAERAGAAQYAVHIEEDLRPEDNGNRHDVRKRLSDDNVFDDSDYEIYQGVVGRPGVDFPVMTGIPQTSFNCRKFGNGYFADLETECQVNSLILTHIYINKQKYLMTKY